MKKFYLLAIVMVGILFSGCEQNQMETKHKGHEFVDLGLSVKWATCNVGATTPEEYGNYFAWGDVVPQNTDVMYKWGAEEGELTKYCTKSENGIVDGKTTLDKADDAAAVHWGGKWRMPTKAEMAELMNECTWQWTSQNRVIGYTVTGPNGKSIFLPAAGAAHGDFYDSAGELGLYWSNTLIAQDNETCAYGLCLTSDYVDWSWEGISAWRGIAQSVRPVCP